MGIQEGDSVADIGAGGGYFTFRFAKAVGLTGEVYAVDVDPDMLDYLRDRARNEGWGNVQVVAGRKNDPLLPENRIDLVFLCNVFHHLENRAAYFSRVKGYLRPGGRVAIVDFKQKARWQRWSGHAVERSKILSEMQAAGFRLREEYDFLPEQHFLVFVKTEDESLSK